jgi:ERCC4-related helicase
MAPGCYLPHARVGIFPHPQGHDYRCYQSAIVRTALCYNTLVALPTGTGKTLVAAAVLHNFLQWCPTRLCIFMAPNRALVQQQVGACCAYMGLSPEVDAQLLTGEEPPAARKERWAHTAARLIFCTPQVLHNDMRNGLCDPTRICCLVFDECHHARSEKEAYALVARHVREAQRADEHAGARVLGLSATAGSTLAQVQSVINMLHIAKLETRTEHELLSFLHGRTICTHRVPTAGSGSDARPLSYREMLMEPGISALRRLCDAKALDPVAIGQLDAAAMQLCGTNLERMLSRAAQGSAMLGGASVSQVRTLHECHTLLSALVALADAAEGDRAKAAGAGDQGAIAQIEARSHSDDGEAGDDENVAEDADERARLEQLEPLLGAVEAAGVTGEPLATLRARASEAASAVGALGRLGGHAMEWEQRIAPKLATLGTLLEAHLQADTHSRVIAFVNKRANVSALCAHLAGSSRLRGLVRAAPFVGRSNRVGHGAGARGMGQLEQRRTIDDFRSGVYNVLVATSVAEEGLDIGEVNLVVFFDAVDSPIRLVQRLGRTGRKEAGQVFMLLTEAEERKHRETTRLAERMSDAMSSGRGLQLHQPSKPFLPVDDPQKLEMHTVDLGRGAARAGGGAGGCGAAGVGSAGGSKRASCDGSNVLAGIRPRAGGDGGDVGAAACPAGGTIGAAKENHSPHRPGHRPGGGPVSTAAATTAVADLAPTAAPAPAPNRPAWASAKATNLATNLALDLTLDQLSADSVSSEDDEQPIAQRSLAKKRAPARPAAAVAAGVAAGKAGAAAGAAGATTTTSKTSPGLRAAPKAPKAKRPKVALAPTTTPTITPTRTEKGPKAMTPSALTTAPNDGGVRGMACGTAAEPITFIEPDADFAPPAPVLLASLEGGAPAAAAAVEVPLAEPAASPLVVEPRRLVSPWSSNVWLSEEDIQAWMTDGPAAARLKLPVSTSWKAQPRWPVWN